MQVSIAFLLHAMIPASFACLLLAKYLQKPRVNWQVFDLQTVEQHVDDGGAVLVLVADDSFENRNQLNEWLIDEETSTELADLRTMFVVLDPSKYTTVDLGPWTRKIDKYDEPFVWAEREGYAWSAALTGPHAEISFLLCISNIARDFPMETYRSPRIRALLRERVTQFRKSEEATWESISRHQNESQSN